ncbi:MAG: alcohol dehydrogenase catalytic domain-containing protein [Phycisphaerae bacterium]|nr:alcohol dehydrogenase catalytic domain-containing protein [Phycisphaerae bacterium]
MTTAITLPKTMPAVVCHGPRDYRLEEWPVKPPGAGEVTVEILRAGVCASDLKCWRGAPLFWGDEHRAGYAETPCIAGHEFVGRVVALGEGAGEKTGLEIGDLAISEQIVPCWECRFCRRGQYWMCQVHDIYGFKKYLPGAMAKYMTFPARSIVHKVPSDLSPEFGAVIEPLACSLHAVQRAKIELGDVVVVSGCGTLGLGMVAAARLYNPARLVALDLKPHRLAAAMRMGADTALNPAEVDVIGAVRNMTDGYGCDVYIEAAGHPKSVEQGLHMIRRLGRFVEFSVMGEPVTVDWTIIGDTKELDVLGSHLGPYCYPIAIELMRTGKIDPTPIVTHSLPIDQYERALEMMLTGEDSIKVQLEP